MRSRAVHPWRFGLATLLGVTLCLLTAPMALAKFGVKALHVGSASGAADYLYTSGNTVVEQGWVDRGRYYHFDVYDPSGTVRWRSACRPATRNGTVTGSYTLQSGDPLSNATGWRFRLREFSNSSSCASSSSAAHDASLYFDVAAVTSYANSGLTSQQSYFKAGATAYVRVAGVGKVNGAGANSALGPGTWSTSWILPSGATACANTSSSASDLPGSTASGQLPDRTSLPTPALPNLQYRPSLSGGADPWNVEANYETRPCPPFTSANQGQWMLSLSADSTHFVKLPTFTVDAIPPSTTLTGGPSNVTSSTTATFSFSASTQGSTFQCSLDAAPATPCSSPQTYSGLAAGRHTFSVAAVDPAGNVDPNPATSTWTVDMTAPAVTLTTPGAGSYTNNTSPAVAGTAETTVGDSNVTVKLYAGSGIVGTPIQTQTVAVQSGGAWSMSASTLPEGTYTVQAQQTDAASNTGYSAERVFTVDTTPPPVTLYAPANGTHTNDTMPQVSGVAGTGAGDVPTVTVTLTGGGSPVQLTTSVSPSGAWSVTVPQPLADGNYTVQATQQDLAGNTESSYSHLTIDTAPPQTFVDAGPVGVTSSSTATFGFHSTDALSQAGSTFQCQLDGGLWVTCSSPQSSYNLADGTHTLSVEAVDGAGNVDTSGQTVSWTINSTLPAVTLTNPAENSFTDDTTPSFSGTAQTAPGDSSVRVLIYSNTDLSGSPLQTLTATVASDGSWSIISPPLADGTYVAYAQQSGGAGTGTSDTHTFTVNTQPPTTTITVGPPGNSGTGQAAFSFTSSEAGSSFQCQLDGGGWTTCTAPQDYSGLGNGSHTFQVRALDQAGNVGPAASQTWSVNTNLPALTLSSPSDGAFTNNPALSIAGHAGTGSGDAGTVTVKIYSGTSTAGTPLETITTSVASNTGSWTTHPTPGLADGSYTVYAQQDGSAGTAYTAASTFTVDTIPPTTSITSGPQGATSSTSARFVFGSSASPASFQCQLDGGEWTTCTSPQSYSSLGLGLHSFSVRARDAAGNVDPIPPLQTWTVDATAPVTLTSPTDGTTTNNNAPAFSGSASAANGAITVEIDDSGGNAVEFLAASAGSTWSATASPPLADGTYTAFASQLASDGVTTDYSNVIEFTVDTAPPTTTITSGPAASATTTTARFGFTSSKSGSSFECRLDGGSWTPCASPQSYGSLGIGAHSFSVRATDSAGNVDPTPPSESWVIVPSTPPGTPPPPSGPGQSVNPTPSSPASSGAQLTTASSGAQSTTPSNTSGAPTLQLVLRAAGTQHLRRRGPIQLTVTARCNSTCALLITSRVTSTSRYARSHRSQSRMMRPSRVLATRLLAGKVVKLRITLSARARKALVNALAHNRHLTLTLSGLATVPGMNAATATVSSRLVL